MLWNAALFYKGYLVIPSKIPINILEILPDFENFDFKQKESKLPDFECLDTISLPSKDMASGLGKQKVTKSKDSYTTFSFLSVSYLIIFICSLRFPTP